MKNSAPKKINDILQNSSLSRIVEKANFINDLNQKFRKDGQNLIVGFTE